MDPTQQALFDALPANGTANYQEWYNGLTIQQRNSLRANLQPMKRRKLIVTRIEDGQLVIGRGEGA